ncbi:DUF4367 domain-containing protein [Paraliobacillus salinarum]|uniref:DUF4367 domain-containing protein n=1 Tax=Paraliobacillus salinarum TaxID=1158996 RepID=UPI0015F3A7E2|nr:DUF4367 domain-containing protein [Paraliobacillus salinarum]
MSDVDKRDCIDDQLLQKISKEAYSEMPSAVSAKEHMWQNIQSELNEQPEKRSFMLLNKKVLSIASLFIILLMGSLFFHLKDGEAFGWFSDYFVQKQGDQTEISNLVSDKPIEQPPTEPPYDETLQSKELDPMDEEMTLGEAVKEASFHIVTPDYVPKGYQLEKVIRTTYKGAPLENVFLHYANNENSFVITQRKVTGEFYASNMTVNNNTAKVESVDLNGVEATFIDYKDGTTELIWINMRTEIDISGDLQKSELITMAKSLK